MRYELAGKENLEALLTGGGMAAGAVGVGVALAKRALGAVALPLAIGSGLVWLGRNLGESFVDVGDETMRVKMGALFDETIPLNDVARVKETEWGILGGLGVRTNLQNWVAVVSKTGHVADIYALDRQPREPRYVHRRSAGTAPLVTLPNRPSTLPSAASTSDKFASE
jgi:hypothetical protein